MKETTWKNSMSWRTLPILSATSWREGPCNIICFAETGVSLRRNHRNLPKFEVVSYRTLRIDGFARRIVSQRSHGTNPPPDSACCAPGFMLLVTLQAQRLDRFHDVTRWGGGGEARVSCSVTIIIPRALTFLCMLGRACIIGTPYRTTLSIHAEKTTLSAKSRQ